MKRIFFLVVLSQLILSCSYTERFPELVTLPVNPNGEEIVLETGNSVVQENLSADRETKLSAELTGLLAMQQMYLQKDEQFDAEKIVTLWRELKSSTAPDQLTETEALHWFQITGFLLQLTGKEEFAEELEKIAWIKFSDDPEVFDSLVSPYIFTKKVDHIHVNLFLPTEISYEHTLGGGVKISQETNLPESGSIRLNFSMEIKRYIEIFVRIPEWAENASVTVKGVKYFAQPGEYCIIAKKWKEGDVIEIEFPLENLPGYLKREV